MATEECPGCTLLGYFSHQEPVSHCRSLPASLLLNPDCYGAQQGGF